MNHIQITRLFFIVFLGVFSSQSWAEKSCKYLEGTWTTHIDSGTIDKRNGTKSPLAIDDELQLQGQNYKKSFSNTSGYSMSFDGSYSCNKLNEKNYVFTLKYPDGATSSFYITLSDNGLNWSGYLTDSTGREYQSEYTRISALPESTSITGDDARSCAVKKDSSSNPTYTLQNICKDAINLKYTFTRSKPFAGTYVTLQPNQETFETANQDEKYKYLACFFPKAPSAIGGRCK